MSELTVKVPVGWVTLLTMIAMLMAVLLMLKVMMITVVHIVHFFCHTRAHVEQNEIVAAGTTATATHGWQRWQ